jgi:nicotinamidase-related amidase
MTAIRVGSLRALGTVCAVAACVAARPSLAQTIVDEWPSVKAPPPPVLKPVWLDRRTTALLMLDFNQQTCNLQRRPRCIESLPKVKPLLAAARAAGVPVVYTLGGGGKPADILPEVAAAAGEPIVSSGVDKFYGTDLEKILKDNGVKTIVAVGTAANGAVLYTASGAAMRGMNVVIPVDGVSAETPYIEQYIAWHLVNVPVISPAMTLTKLSDVSF